MFSVPTKPGENRGERLGEFESRSMKPETQPYLRPLFFEQEDILFFFLYEMLNNDFN